MMKKVVITVLAVIGIIATACVSSANAATAVICGPNEGIQITGHSLDAAFIPRLDKFLAQGEIAFYVTCPPIEGSLDLRLQQFHPKEDLWETVGTAEVKDVGDGKVTVDEHFTMRRIHECEGNLSWRIRLFIAPGIAGDGTHHRAEVLFFPKRVGKQLDYERPH